MRATVAKRVQAFVADALVVFFGSLLLQLILGGLSGLTNPIFAVLGLSLSPGIYLINVVAVLAYFVALRGLTEDQTLGARSAHLRMVAPGKGSLDPALAARRLVVALVGALLIGFGYWSALLDPERRTLADRVCGTTSVPVTSEEHGL
jgi:hypothetical protein